MYLGSKQEPEAIASAGLDQTREGAAVAVRRKRWVCIPALPLLSCVTLGTVLIFSVPQFLIFKVGGLNESKHANTCSKCLAHGECLVNIIRVLPIQATSEEKEKDGILLL